MPGGWDIFTPPSFSSRDSTKSLTTSWSSPRSQGLTLRISWSKMPRGSSHTGPCQSYAPAMRSLCCKRSLASRTSPGSTQARDCCCGLITTVVNNWGVKISRPPGLKNTYKYGKMTCPVCLKALRGIKMDLQIKVGWVLKNSGNSLCDRHWNFPIWTIGSWEICN